MTAFFYWYAPTAPHWRTEKPFFDFPPCQAARLGFSFSFINAKPSGSGVAEPGTETKWLSDGHLCMRSCVHKWSHSFDTLSHLNYDLCTHLLKHLYTHYGGSAWSGKDRHGWRFT